MDKAKNRSKLLTPPREVEDYYNSNSCAPSLKQASRSETEAESSKSTVMPVMTIGTNSLEEEMAAMKAMMEKIIKESEKKEACIKLQEETIVRLTKKLEKQPTWSLTKSSQSEEERTSAQCETSDEEGNSKKGDKLKNDGSSSLMAIEQIYDLIVNAMKVELGRGACETHNLYQALH